MDKAAEIQNILSPIMDASKRRFDDTLARLTRNEIGFAEADAETRANVASAHAEINKALAKHLLKTAVSGPLIDFMKQKMPEAFGGPLDLPPSRCEKHDCGLMPNGQCIHCNTEFVDDLSATPGTSTVKG